MDLANIYFLALVAAGAMVQTITGFAMGLIIIGGVAALALADIGLAAAVISLISLVNAAVALRHTYKFIDSSFVLWICAGMLPMIVVGVFILEYLSATSYEMLRIILGIFIVTAGTLLMLKPSPFGRISVPWVRIVVGGVGGIMGGTYGAGGAPLAYFMYRQPLDINIIRASLLAVFGLSTLFRSVTVALAGQLNQEVLMLAGFSVPVVIFVTVMTSRVSHHIPDALVRKFVFVLLIMLGVFLIVS